MAPLTVVFVCTGNTCRSPLAMSLAQQLWPEGTVFRSAGLSAATGQPAAVAAVAVAAERGLDLGSHRSRRLDADLAAEADWLIGMTSAHVAVLQQQLRGSNTRRIGLLGCPNQDLTDRPIPAAEEITDPFGEAVAAYRNTADQLERLLRDWTPIFGNTAGGSA
ncbi:MAG: low molecular weight protein arginine phosphatase [Candidatus Krumholzibacteria bacterium]|nr:low molecular weight protein arginine phosphatase [Candidatus Krumholzibacteria bacterium]